MNKEDLGNYFLNDGDIFYCIGYIDRPCLKLKNERTGERCTIVIGSRVSEGFKRLVCEAFDGNIEREIRINAYERTIEDGNQTQNR